VSALFVFTKGEFLKAGLSMTSGLRQLPWTCYNGRENSVGNAAHAVTLDALRREAKQNHWISEI